MKLSFTKNTTEKVSKFEYCTDFDTLDIGFFKDNVINPTFVSLYTKHITQYTHSIYTYTDGRKAKDCVSASGVIVDVDNSCDIAKFQQDWQQYHYILYTSKSHQKPKGDMLPCDRFHIFFPYQKDVVLDDSNRQEYIRSLSAWVDSTPYFDQQVKDLGRIIFRSPQDALILTNLGIKYLNPSTFVLKSVEAKKQETDTTRPRNDYTLETLQDCLEILVSVKIEHNFYKKICAWAREEPQQTKDIVCGILGKNPFYPEDTPEIVLKDILSFPRSDVNFASIYQRAKEINPNYKQKGMPTQKHWHGLDTNLEYNEADFNHCLAFFNSVLGYSNQTKSYFLKSKIDGWVEHRALEIGEALSHFCIEEKTKKGVTRKPFFPIWKQSPQKRVFLETTYDFETRTNNYILNTAPELVGLPGAVDHINGLSLIDPVLRILKDSICDGDEKKLTYLMVWVAYVTNYKKTGIGVQIKGASGTGKTSFRLFLEKFLHPKTYTKIAKDSQLVGKFNSQLVGKILVTSEEAIYAGNTSHSEVLKDLITDETMELEKKGKDVVTNIRNYINVLFLSNRDIVTKLDVDDRRFFIMTTSDKYSKERHPDRAEEIGEAFRKFKLALTDIKVLESFQVVFEDLRKKYPIHWLSEPKNMWTKEKKEVQLRSLNPIDEFLHTLYTESFAMPIKAEREDGFGKIAYTKMYIDTSSTFFLFDELYTYFLSIGRENRYHSRNMFRRELSVYLIEKVLKNIEGVVDKKIAKRGVVVDKKKVLEHLQNMGIEIEVEKKMVDNVIGFDKIPVGL